MSDPSPPSSLYRAVWRWHFYAGLLVLPFLVLLAVTGALYLFRPELNHVLYHDMIDVPARTTAPAPVSVVMANVEMTLDGRVEQVTLPDRTDRSLQFLVRVGSGEARTAYADPYDGHYLGSTSYGGVLQFIRKIHSLQYFGFWASSLIEIAAGWAIILAGTGLFLWWPRGRKGGVVTVRGSPKTRPFWRDLHAVTGAFASIVILFLALTGMPWSMFWGDHMQKWTTEANLNMPKPPADVMPGWMLSASMPGMDHSPHAHGEHSMLPWALQQAPMPQSHASHDIGLDGAIAKFEAMGLDRPFSVQPAEGEHGAYVGSFTPDQANRERTIYLARDGAVLGDVGFSGYGPVAKVVEWGIMVHQGQQYGRVNRYVMLAGCIAIMMLAISAVTMWWKRRPKGTLGVPPASIDANAKRMVLGVMIVVGLIFPLVGVSIAIALAIDVSLQSLRRASSSAH